MIAELYIRNLAIIDEVRLEFSPGFNVLTGETGAGKSIILDAVSLVLGERADTTIIRDGSDGAYVESLFQLDSRTKSLVEPLLIEEGLEGDADDQLLLSREVRETGRSVGRVNGRAANLALIRTIGDILVDIHGQGEHLSLLRPKSHLPLLDAYANLLGERATFAANVAALRKVRRMIADLRQDADVLARRKEQLSYQIQDIDAANLVPEEDVSLESERIQLANVEKLLLHGSEVLALLDGVNSESPGASDLIGQAEMSLTYLARVDEGQKKLAESLKDLSFQLGDIIAELSRYCERLEHSPNRLDYVEERLELINSLKRKYGRSIEAVLEKRSQALLELENIDNSEFRLQELMAEEEATLRQLGNAGRLLSENRQRAAVKLAREVEEELSELNMLQSRFDVDFSRTHDDSGAFVGDARISFDETGIDHLEFRVSANPGEPLRPLAKVASGGETSRLMLALKTVLARVDETPTLIFDEVDQGIGGRVGDIVGQKLWRITQSSGHQVIIVTHLPQLAGYADGHYQISKQLVGDRTTTQVYQLNDEGRLGELAAMLGTSGEHAVGGAGSILKRVETIKSGV